MIKIEVGLGLLIGFFGDRNVFPRLRTPPWALGVRLYIEGLSLRRVAGILGSDSRLTMRVRDWFPRACEAFSSVARRKRGPIAVD
ncbi:MAG: hypothetical protein QXX95_02225 [Nitrososphaerales archaeon]